MTQTQISTCLASIGLREDTYSTLDKISSINLHNDASIYPSNGREYYFDSSKSLLLEYSVKNEERHLETIIDYDLICGFTFVSKFHPKNVHVYGRSV